MSTKEKYLSAVANYYSDKITEHGASPKGVDWNGEESQSIRFSQLCRLLPDNLATEFTLNDLGCGYASLYDFLAVRYANYRYCGYDVSNKMVKVAHQRVGENANVDIKCTSQVDAVADFGIASGIFNVRLELKDEDWLEYIKKTLQNLDATSGRGFAFNCLTSYSDPDKKKDYLYYADPNQIFDLCKKQFSRNVALLHDYDLYEFTLLVRKS